MKCDGLGVGVELAAGGGCQEMRMEVVRPGGGGWGQMRFDWILFMINTTEITKKHHESNVDVFVQLICPERPIKCLNC